MGAKLIKEKREDSKIKKLFNKLDTNKDGDISVEELM